ASSYDPLAEEGAFQTTAARRWVDSSVIPGDCRLECPEGTTFRRGDEGRACYEYTTYTIQEQVVTDNWRETDFEEWSNYPRERRRRDRQRVEVCEEVCFFIWCWEECRNEQVWVYEVNDPTTEIVEREVTDWRYVQERVEICEDDGIVPGTWQALDDDVHNPPHVDCRNDVDTGNTGNGTIGSGYPQNNVATGSEYGPNPDTSESLWGNQPYGFYTSHYLNWYYDDSLVEPRPRLDIAQDVVSQLIRTNPGIDFGLMEFNFDAGGRVVQRIIENMGDDERDNLVDMVNLIDHGGSTPICESMYEAYRYINGDSVLYGTQNRDGADTIGTWDVLPRDLQAERDGVYRSPTTDCAYTYVILMTDGEPQRDTGANDRIEELTGETCDRYRDADGNMTKNCLPQLAQHMANTDLDGDSSNGNQYAITYTIGFTTDQALLSDAAVLGKGEYYTANSAQELTEAFQGAIYSILSTDTTFTSPAVAVDTFTRTQSRDEVFYAMFRPTERVNWPGNIKKLKLVENESGAVLVDANGNAAIDENTGYIKDSATTFWGSLQDGGSVDAGGVGGRLILRNPSTRVIYSDTGSGGALEAFQASNLSPGDYGLGNDAGLWSLFGSSTEAGFLKQVAWARGLDAYDQDGDGDSSEARDWILGDILHSQPEVVNYGSQEGSLDAEVLQGSPDMRIVVGTNAGFVHMFGAVDGEEDWAFTPKALVDVHRQRRQNRLTSDNVYGMDLTPVTYRLDLNGNGTIEPGEGDKVYLYLGMRRGGRSLYAMDITSPDNPSLLWTRGPADAGFAELGQTWSRPVPTFVPGYKDANGNHKPVVIFGAGYDDRKDAGGVATADSMGRGLFVVDAVSGALVWSVTPNSSSATNMQETSLLHSVAADVTPVDGNGDGITDRVYFGDTGGNVWRVDMPGNTLPDSSQDSWFIVKVADVNAGSEATDRRIHNAIDVVRTRF
ncbi:MAG TPA: PilC/PilY family type IV pilus protein, partial [Pseudohaliea sp.]|nr:PilC/PilY family type IV pilus protein [Pseudohaliea sp.]